MTQKPGLLETLRKYSEWIIPTGAVALVFVMLVPLPSIVLDLLLTNRATEAAGQELIRLHEWMGWLIRRIAQFNPVRRAQRNVAHQGSCAHQPHRAALGADLRAVFCQHHLRNL